MYKILIPLLFLLPRLFQAQPCTYLAYDGFDYPANTPLNNQSGGGGWNGVWNVQANDETLPGYQTNTGAGSLAYGALLGQGRYAIGGQAYLTAGRRLSTSDSGPFAAYVQTGQNGIGTAANGDTLWASVLLQKQQNNNDEVWFDLHNDGNIPWCTGCAQQHIAVGYFGSANSNVGGQRRWTLRLNNNYYPTDIPITTGTTVFAVLRIIFNPGNTAVALYLNPAGLGNDIPLSPTLAQSTGAENAIRSAGVYLGNTPGNGAVDEIRLAERYACAAPDNTVALNLPPVAAITLTPASGSAPLQVQLDGASSYDPEGGALTYEWNFGDASPAEQSAAASHTYNDLGQITVSLTVTDPLGLQHTTFKTVTVTNANGTYPCQSAFSVLKMADCGQNNGRIRINSSLASSYSLTSPAGQTMPLSNGNEYHNLAPGIYTFMASGGQCRDTFQLFIRTDSASCAGWEPNACDLHIGTNMSGFADWVVERPMKNLMKHVRPEPIPYTPDCFCWYIPVLDEMSFDENGYPTHLPQNTSAGSNTVLRYIISSEDANLQPGQQYVFLYEGSGVLSIPAGASIQSQTPGRIQFAVTTGGNMWVDIASSEAANPLRNFRLLRLADENADLDAEPFYPGFLDKIEPFAALRFMDWGATNGNPLVHWDDRADTGYFTYGTPAGVPYEVMIELANQTQKDVWICVPHAADEEYVAQMAALFKNGLDTGITVYLEYSNEVWNWIFAQAHYNDQNRPNNLNYGRAYAEKAKHSFRIWHEIWGADKHRVKRVLGMQATYNFLNEQILSQLDPDDWDYGSPTFYFGLDHGNSGNPPLTATSSAQDVVTNARNAWHAGKHLFKNDYNQVHLFGKEVINYEGGQHFTNFTVPPYINAMYAAQYTPEMYALYDEVIDTTRRWGSRLAMHFSLAGRQESIYGSWGSISDIDQPAPWFSTAPKYQALLDNIPDCAPTPSETTGPMLTTGVQITLSPNPVSDQLLIRCEAPGLLRHVEILYADGRVARRHQAGGAPQTSVEMGDLPAGLYVVRMECGDGQWVVRKVVRL